MAFSTSNVQTGRIFGGVNTYIGDWSGTAGDAPGTITLGGGRVYLAHFECQDSTGGPVELVPCSVSVSSGTITLTVNNHDTVTLGRFFVVFA